MKAGLVVLAPALTQLDSVQLSHLAIGPSGASPGDQKEAPRLCRAWSKHLGSRAGFEANAPAEWRVVERDEMVA